MTVKAGLTVIWTKKSISTGTGLGKKIKPASHGSVIVNRPGKKHNCQITVKIHITDYDIQHTVVEKFFHVVSTLILQWIQVLKVVIKLFLPVQNDFSFCYLDSFQIKCLFEGSILSILLNETMTVYVVMHTTIPRDITLTSKQNYTIN